MVIGNFRLRQGEFFGYLRMKGMVTNRCDDSTFCLALLIFETHGTVIMKAVLIPKHREYFIVCEECQISQRSLDEIGGLQRDSSQSNGGVQIGNAQVVPD